MGPALKQQVTSPDNLTWTVRRLVVPLATRPAVGETSRSSGPALVSGLIAFAVSLPVLPVVLLLRRAHVLPWTLEARTYPWGRRGGPPVVLRYAVDGDVETAFAELAAALARGDGSPVIANAERI